LRLTESRIRRRARGRGTSEEDDFVERQLEILMERKLADDFESNYTSNNSKQYKMSNKNIPPQKKKFSFG
jgi:hypothetical protein